jgi:hypothetical protein
MHSLQRRYRAHTGDAASDSSRCAKGLRSDGSGFEQRGRRSRSRLLIAALLTVRTSERGKGDGQDHPDRPAAPRAYLCSAFLRRVAPPLPEHGLLRRRAVRKRQTTAKLPLFGAGQPAQEALHPVERVLVTSRPLHSKETKDANGKRCGGSHLFCLRLYREQRGRVHIRFSKHRRILESGARCRFYLQRPGQGTMKEDLSEAKSCNNFPSRCPSPPKSSWLKNLAKIWPISAGDPIMAEMMSPK